MSFTPQTVNYATQYSQELSQTFPYTLYFGALYASPANGRYRFVNARTIEIPTLSVAGRKDSNRDNIQTAARRYNNSWTPLALSNERQWDTLVHPQDIDETDMVASIANITKVFNEEQKFPEMDAYTISKIYADWTAKSKTASTTALTVETILGEFDAMLQGLVEARVPKNGLILYITPAVNTLLKNAQGITRELLTGPQAAIVQRAIAELDDVQIEEVPSDLMKTVYDFTEGWAPASTAKQINMMLIKPEAVITPVSYEFATLDQPSAVTGGKYYYYEESHEDVFVLPNKQDAIAFNITA